MKQEAGFLRKLRNVVEPGEWVTCAVVARRLHPKDADIVQRSREVSRELSNLQRWGNLERREVGANRGANCPIGPKHYEYRLAPVREARIAHAIPLWAACLVSPT